MPYSGSLVPTPLTALLPPDRPACSQMALDLPKHASGASGSPPASRPRHRESSLLLTLVAVIHVAGAISLARLSPAPRQLDSPPIVVALIGPSGDASSQTAAAAEQPSAPATPESASAPPAPPEPPPPQPQAVTPPPLAPAPTELQPPPKPKPVAADKPKPKPKPPRETPQPKPQPAAAPATTVATASEPSNGPAQASTPTATAGPQGSPNPSANAASNQITPARFDAGYLNNPAPAYPPLARRLQEQGKVMLRVHVSADGKPGKIELSSSSGSDRLDKAAQAAVARWRFVPARQGDRNVETWVIVPIIFKLEGS